MADAKKIDPFDVEALEKSLNDSATRVSTIWVSFLIFSLYLLTAATTVTHRQLLLAEPVKLPVLNIDLPLWGFFFLAPILFVIFHTYVLLQVLLLGRTATAYDEALDKAVKPPPSNAAMRQRLANTLFAQIFAGSPREREGWLGWLLKAMAWITLAIAPILILLAFQSAFLPYHSHLVTWTHRLLILIELSALFWLWPLVLDARRDFEWTRMQWPFTGRTVIPVDRRMSTGWRLRVWSGLRQHALSLLTCTTFIFLSLGLATFPGEPHVNLFTGQPLLSVQCIRWFSDKIDRLDLQNVDVVDDDKLAKIVQHTIERELREDAGERTQIFRGRNLNCSDISSGDFRRVDLTEAQMIGADLSWTAFDGATLTGVRLSGSNLSFAELHGTNLGRAQLQGAYLAGARLQAAVLDRAQLQGAILDDAQLQGASLFLTQLQGASLRGTRLQGAYLDGTELQGASLVLAKLQGAFLIRTQLQGASLERANLEYAVVQDASILRARNVACANSRVINPDSRAIVKLERDIELVRTTPDEVQATPNEIRDFILRSISDIPVGEINDRAREWMQVGLIIDPSDDEKISKIWNDCAEIYSERERISPGQFDLEQANFLSNLACNAVDERKTIVYGVVRNGIKDSRGGRSNFSEHLARGLLGEDGRTCTATKDLDETTKGLLREIIRSADSALAISKPIALPPAYSAAPTVPVK